MDSIGENGGAMHLRYSSANVSEMSCIQPDLTLSIKATDSYQHVCTQGIVFS